MTSKSLSLGQLRTAQQQCWAPGLRHEYPASFLDAEPTEANLGTGQSSSKQSESLAEHDGLIVLLVARRVDEGERPLARYRAQLA